MNITDFAAHRVPFYDYIRDVKKLSYNTHKSYLLDMEQFYAFWQENSKLNFDDALAQFFHSLTLHEQKATSIARKVSCFNSFKHYLALFDIKLTIPVKRPLVRLAAPQTIDENIIATMEISPEQLATKRPLREKAIILMLYQTGIKVSELIALEIGHLNIPQRFLTVRGKKKQERTITFDEQLRQTLHAYLRYERKEVTDNNERFFLNHMNKPLTARSIQQICKLFSAHVLHKPITPSILRNSRAQHLLAKGIDEHEVQKMLGHKIPISTQRYKKNSVG